MVKSWITYMVLLISALLFNLFLDTGTAAAILLILIAQPVICFVFHRFHSCRLELSVYMPETATKNQTINGTLRITNHSRLPFGAVRCDLISKNALTGETTEIPLSFSVSPGGSSEVPLKIKSAFCGQVVFAVAKLKVYDLLGLTYKKRTPAIGGSVTVIPDLFETELILDSSYGFDKDGTEYSTEKPGFDLSEPFGIREYIEGDSPKNIHWKLSGKLDKLIVREPGLPVEKSVLLLFETGNPKELPSPDICDALAQAFVSVSQSLLSGGISHTIGWHDRITDNFLTYMLKNEDELAGVLSKILSAGQSKDDENCLSHYIRLFDSVDFSHVVVVSPYEPQEIGSSTSTKITLLVADKNTDSDLAITFSPETITEDLYRLTI